MKGLSLFSGSGIGELAFKHIIPNYRTIGYVEIDKYCRSIIRARIRDGVLDDAPIFDDIRTFNERYARRYIGKVDLISGGFPCQPFSVAGKQKGEHDERNLWPDTLRSISIIRPKFALLENVPNILTHKYVMRIFGDLVEIGYDCEWDVVSAAFCGAPHLRKRVWILAHTESPERKLPRDSWPRGDESTNSSQTNSNTSGIGLSEGDKFRSQVFNGGEKTQSKRAVDSTEFGQMGTNVSGERKGLSSECSWWTTEPSVGRVVDGLACRVDRLKACGNGWVPQVVERILQINTEDTI